MFLLKILLAWFSYRAAHMCCLIFFGTEWLQHRKIDRNPLWYALVPESLVAWNKGKHVQLNEYSRVWQLSALQKCLDAMNPLRYYMRRRGPHATRFHQQFKEIKGQIDGHIIMKARHATRFCKTGQNCTRRNLMCSNICGLKTYWTIFIEKILRLVVVSVCSIIESSPFS